MDLYHLVIDTSTEKGIVLISNGSEPLFVQRLPEGQPGSRLLFEAIQTGFKYLNIGVQDIGCVAVTTGPGLFTGIRVGVAAAKGIAYGQGLPLIGLCSLSGFVSLDKVDFVSAIDGRSQGVFVLQQRREAAGFEELFAMQLLSLEEVVQSEQFFVGPSFGRIGVKNSIEVWPDPTHLAQIVSHKFSSNQFNKLQLSY